MADLIISEGQTYVHQDESGEIVLNLDSLTMGPNSRFEIKSGVGSFKITALTTNIGEGARIFAQRGLLKRTNANNGARVSGYGTSGKGGRNGKAGRSGTQIQLRFNLTNLDGLVVESNGGLGGRGGNGSDGNQGEDGDWIGRRAKDGGAGGKGGNGGNGGNGGDIVFQYHWINSNFGTDPKVRLKSLSGDGGHKGLPGISGGSGDRGLRENFPGNKKPRTRNKLGKQGKKGKRGQQGKRRLKEFTAPLVFTT